MYVEFLNVTKGTATYAAGSVSDLFANPWYQNLQLADCGDDTNHILELITPVINRLTDLEPCDSFQIRLFSMSPDDSILTNRIMTRAIYWANWSSGTKSFNFERVTR